MLNLCSVSLLLLALLFLYFFTSRYYLLSSLLVLESLVLMLLIFTITISFTMFGTLSMYLFVLTLSVSEAAIGLSLLVSYGKYKGSDLMLSTTVQG
uniref:NADH dehydrogenase subunit 4L n=1 Tax=Zaptyx sarissa TaxID=1885888 RepID=A0A224A224_9EUPU|nr:NADH dehydrogenase subunit 4L [Zaptyx sarissa]